MKRIPFIFLLLGSTAAFYSCSKQSAAEQEAVPQAVSVQTALVTRGDIAKTITFRGQTVCIRKSDIVSPLSGYVESISVHLGDPVHKNDPLYEIRTPESQALIASGSGDAIHPVKIASPTDGFISDQVIQENGMYISEGTVLCTIADENAIIIQASIPYENHQLLKMDAPCRILLPDGQNYPARVSRILPVIQSDDQTQTIWVQPDHAVPLPENLKLEIEFTESSHRNSVLVPKAAVLTDETQHEFWVMTINPDSLAIQLLVETGLSNESLTEILSGNLHPGQFVITSGAYGLPDSTLVTREHQ